MSDTQKKIPLMVTPKGPAAYAWLSKPDEKFKKGGKAVYKVTVLFPKSDIPPGRINFGKETLKGPDWMKHIQALCKEHGVASKPGTRGCPIQDGDKQKDKDGKPKEQFQGMWMMTFKSTFKPDLLDSKGKALPSSIPVYSGDIVKVAFAAKPVEVTKEVEKEDGTVESRTVCYLSLYLNKVMLIEKLAGSGGVEFGEEEGGFEVPEGAEDDDVDMGDEDDSDGDF